MPGLRGSPWTRSFARRIKGLDISYSRRGRRQRSRGTAPQLKQVLGRGKTKWHWAPVPARAGHGQTAQRRDPRQSLKSAPHKPLKTKAKHSQAPRPQETPVLLWCRTKDTRVPQKGSPHSPQGVLPGTTPFFDNLASQPAAILASQSPSNATNATGCNMKSKNPHRVTARAGPGLAGPTRTEPRRKNATKCNTNHKNGHPVTARRRCGPTIAHYITERTQFPQPRNAKQNFN